MSRETKLKSLLDRVRAKRPEERASRAGSIATDASRVSSVPPRRSPTITATPVPPASSAPVEPARAASMPAPQSTPAFSTPAPPAPVSSLPAPSAGLHSSVAPSMPAAGASIPTAESVRAARSGRPVAIRADSVQPGDQPVAVTTGSAEFPRASTFGELLELTLALRPR